MSKDNLYDDDGIPIPAVSAKDFDVKGNPISIQWYKENGENWIIIKDCVGNILMKVRKSLWDTKGAGFSAELRDSILEKARRLYG